MAGPTAHAGNLSRWLLTFWPVCVAARCCVGVVQVRVAKDIAVQLSDILSEKDFVGVVNAPNIDFARKSKLIPYLSLAEKIGSLQAQLIGAGKIRRIVITLQGKQGHDTGVQHGADHERASYSGQHCSNEQCV